APRRRPPVDREPAADVERRGSVPGVARLMTTRRPRSQRRPRGPGRLPRLRPPQRTLRVGILCVLCGLSVPSSSPRAQETPSAMIRIGVQKNGGYDVVTLPLETYVARVLTGEALPGSDPAALE